MYHRRVGDRLLRFETAEPGRYRDLETGSVWTLDGRAIDGPLQAQRLEPVVHGDFFWFAWVVFRPHTRIWRR